MNIGIDGGALSITDDRLKVGTYRVAYNLVKELPRIDVKSFYRIYSFGRGEEGIGKLAGNNTQFIRLPRPGFATIWQPLELLCNPADAYLGISQSLPLTLYDVTKIGFIYDVGFLDHPQYYRQSYFALSTQTAGVVKRASHIITISNASAESIRRHYHVPKGKLTVAYLGSEKCFRPTGKKHKDSHPYFLFVGSLKPGKNVPMMIRAFHKFLKESKKQYDFLLVGSDFWLDPGISATISALNLKDRVHMVGFVDDETLATYYRGAQASLSVSKIEGFGLPVVEAMASGCPVIGSLAGSHPEVIGRNGILIDPDDEVTLQKAMQTVVYNAKRRASMIADGLVQSKRFRWKTFAKTVYEKIQDSARSR